ncbi:ABC transporter ATP-binding protein [[Acholeplasma] multilocale]|uniref:ABC transporter ATP-binding protein n=1 Tax=[Acholeplasma] multilocale TaxID=264638 RepID=UPI000478D120|nr:ABC transporter B family permease/ATP-binding protein [[Acholeplasma] multilocale]
MQTNGQNVQNEQKQKKERQKFDSQYKFTWAKLGSFLGIIFEEAKKNKLLFITMVFMTALDSVLAALLPIASARMVSLLSATDANPAPGNALNFLGMDMVWTSWIYVLLVIFAFMLVAEYLTNFTIGLFSAKVEVAQRNKILISLVNQEVDFFFDHVSGNILTRLVADTQGLSLGIQQFLTNIIYCGVGLTAAVVILFVEQHTLIAAVSLAYMAVVIFVAVLIFIQFRRRMITAFDIKRDVDTDMTDRIGNISLIKSSGLEMYEIDRLGAMNEKYNRAGDSTVRWSAALNLWVSMGTGFLSTFIIIIAAIRFVNGDTTIYASLTLALPLVSQMVISIVMLVPTLRAATRASNCADRIGELTEPIPEIQPNVDGFQVESIETVEFKNLDFAYPKKKDKIILPNINVKFEKGKSYAFVGETGSGKSTIARLLLRFYDPLNGEVIINGKHNLKDINMPAYLSHIGYVEQEPQIFFGDFFDNIRYSKMEATDAEVIAACKKAKLHDFIMTLPEGYNTILGQRGFLLSGGQKQRLVIARVFLKNPDLVILDEATSALDNIVEKEIQAQLDELVKGKTSITIAHRLSTIKNADVIIVLGAGTGIVQTGTYEELIKVEGHFKKLHEAGLMK